MITVVVTYPVEIVKNRIASAASAKGPGNALDVVREIYRLGGLRGFYDGVGVSAGENALEKFLYFYVYTAIRNFLQRLRGGPSTLVDLAAGSLSELAHLPVTVPLDTLLIKVVNSPTSSVAALVRDMLKGGLAELYAGAVPSAILCIKPAVQFAFFEAIKARVLQRASVKLPKGGPSPAALTMGQAFVAGAIARALATLIVFPYMRAKFALKAGLGAESGAARQSNPFVGLHWALWWVAQQQGIQGLYMGLPQELTRATMSAALLMAVRERLTLTISRAMATGAR